MSMPSSNRGPSLDSTVPGAPAAPPPPPITATEAEVAAYRALRRRQWGLAVSSALLLLLATTPWMVMRLVEAAEKNRQGDIVGGLILAGVVCLVLAAGYGLFLLGSGVQNAHGMAMLSFPAIALIIGYISLAKGDRTIDFVAPTVGILLAFGGLVLMVASNHTRYRIQGYRDRWEMDKRQTEEPPAPEVPMEEHEVPAGWDSAGGAPRGPHAPATPPGQARQEDDGW